MLKSKYKTQTETETQTEREGEGETDFSRNYNPDVEKTLVIVNSYPN